MLIEVDNKLGAQDSLFSIKYFAKNALFSKDFSEIALMFWNTLGPEKTFVSHHLPTHAKPPTPRPFMFFYKMLTLNVPTIFNSSVLKRSSRNYCLDLKYF